MKLNIFGIKLPEKSNLEKLVLETLRHLFRIPTIIAITAVLVLIRHRLSLPPNPHDLLAPAVEIFRVKIHDIIPLIIIGYIALSVLFNKFLKTI